MIKKVHFCRFCGTRMTTRKIEGRVREICPSCNVIHYEHRKLSAGVQIVENHKLLLVQRSIEPFNGKWYLPSGFVEVDEEPRAAAEREALEETGLTVRTGKLIDCYSYADDPRGNGMVLIYQADRVEGNIHPTEEAVCVTFFSADEVRNLELAGECHTKAINHWLENVNSPKEGND